MTSFPSLTLKNGVACSLRFSGKNMSPLPCFLAGAQFACLNFTDNDLAVMLHFALFSGSGGFVLKPSEMRMGSSDCDSFRNASLSDASPSCYRRPAVCRVLSAGMSQQADDNDVHWPPPRAILTCVSIRAISLHNLPKVCFTFHMALKGAVRERLNVQGAHA